MGDHLHGSASIIPAALFLKNRPVDLPRRHIGIPIQTLVYEPLIMTQIQIGLRTVVRHIDFPVLDRVHRSRVNINIRIEFLHRDLISPCFQKPP